jgi:hypothetical protein
VCLGGTHARELCGWCWGRRGFVWPAKDGAHGQGRIGKGTDRSKRRRAVDAEREVVLVLGRRDRWKSGLVARTSAAVCRGRALFTAAHVNFRVGRRAQKELPGRIDSNRTSPDARSGSMYFSRFSILPKATQYILFRKWLQVQLSLPKVMSSGMRVHIGTNA